MTSLAYDSIFSQFLGYISDYDIASLDFSDANEFMSECLHKALAKPYIRRLFSSSSLDDEIQMFQFEMKYVVEPSADLDFVQDILSKGMVIEWLQPQVKSKNLTAQIFTGKEQKFFSQANHLSELRNLLEDAQLEQRKLIRDRGYINNLYLNN